MARQSSGALPHNLDAERALLGTILVDNETLYEVGGLLVKGDFYEPGNGEIFTVLKDHIEAGRVATAVTILHDITQDADIGGMTASEYLALLTRSSVPRVAAVELARGIKDNAMRRRVIEAAEQMINEARYAPVTVAAETIRDKYDAAFSSLFATTEDLGIRKLHEFGTALVDQAAAAYEKDTDVGLAVGLKGVQDLTGPLLPASVYVLAGPPGSGKSALGQQIGEYVSATPRQSRGPKDTACPVSLMNSAEMPGTQVAGRALTAETGITSLKIRTARLAQREIEQLIEANERIRDIPFYVDGKKNPSVASIRSKALRLKRLVGLDLLIIDHLLYLAPPVRGMLTVEAIAPNMQEIKALADDLKVPVVVLAQLKGSFNAGPVRRPMVSDLWNDSAVEQNADVIFFAHRPEYLHGRREPDKGAKDYPDWQAAMELWKGRAEIVLGKNRDGAGFGVSQMFFDAPRMRFSDNLTGTTMRFDEPAEFDFQPPGKA